MKSFKTIFAFFLISICFIPFNLQAAELCHIANAGFYASDGEKGVLLDALFADGLPDYPTASPALLDDLENAKGRFNNVQLIFSSHYHDDHMKGEPIIRHLKANSNARIILTPQALNKAKEAGLSDVDVKRVYSEVPKIGQQKIIEDMPFPVTLYGISHGQGRPIENIGIMVTVAGQTIMHVGDIFADIDDLKRSGINKLKVDWLLMPSWYLDNSESVAFLGQAFDARHIIPMHFAVDNNDWIISQGGMEKYKQTVYGAMANLIRLEDEMACVSLDE